MNKIAEALFFILLIILPVFLFIWMSQTLPEATKGLTEYLLNTY